MLEKTVKLAVRKRLKELGAFQFWPVVIGLGETTVDCLGCYKGRMFGIETKAPGKKPTMRQQHTLEKIRAAGGIGLVIDTPEQARALFTDHFKSD